MLSLAARLPSDIEREGVEKNGSCAVRQVLIALMREDAFYECLLEGFNDIFLTVGYTMVSP